jgi:hypothetical protein
MSWTASESISGNNINIFIRDIRIMADAMPLDAFPRLLHVKSVSIFGNNAISVFGSPIAHEISTERAARTSTSSHFLSTRRTPQIPMRWHRLCEQNPVPNVARVSLTLAVIIWIAGHMILCSCPELFVTSAILAALAIKTGKGKLRRYSWIVFVAAAIVTGIHIADGW